jgi:hypothetical protein
MRLEPQTNPDGSFDTLYRRYNANLYNHDLQVPSVTINAPCGPHLTQTRDLSAPLVPERVSNAPLVALDSHNYTMNEFLPDHQSSHLNDDPFDITGLQMNHSERRRLGPSGQSVVNNHQNSAPQSEVHLSNPVEIVNVDHSNPSNGTPQSIPNGSTPLNVSANVFAAPSMPILENRNYSLQNHRLFSDLARRTLQYNATAPPVFNSTGFQAPAQRPLMSNFYILPWTSIYYHRTQPGKLFVQRENNSKFFLLET